MQINLHEDWIIENGEITKNKKHTVARNEEWGVLAEALLPHGYFSGICYDKRNSHLMEDIVVS